MPLSKGDDNVKNEAGNETPDSKSEGSTSQKYSNDSPLDTEDLEEAQDKVDFEPPSILKQKSLKALANSKELLSHQRRNSLSMKKLIANDSDSKLKILDN